MHAHTSNAGATAGFRRRCQTWLLIAGQLFGQLIGLVALTACAQAALGAIPLEVGGQTLQVELAITEAEQVRGLMYRQSLPENAGMLFVYDHPEQVAYWMKNTYVPLSIAFIDGDRHIINMADMAPNNSVRTYPSRGPCKYVLEVNQGWFVKHNVKEGDLVKFTLPARKAA